MKTTAPTSTDLAAERSLGERRPPAHAEQGLLTGSDLRASGLQAVLLEGQQVVVHGVHQQPVAVRVHHHAGHRLDLAHQLAGGDRLEADVGQQLGGVSLTRRVEVEPPHGQLVVHREDVLTCRVLAFHKTKTVQQGKTSKGREM